MLGEGKKRGQASIYIIIAIVIFILIGVVFFISNKVTTDVSLEFAPVYDNYLSCIGDYTREAIDIAGTQGGRIYLQEYSPGSSYAPFSNHLNFFGIPVAYWYYQSANGVIKENVPKKEEIETDISQYVKDRISDCDFESFYAEGYELTFGEVEVSTKINDNDVSVEVDSDLFVSKNVSSSKKSKHTINVESKFGKFFNLANKIYSYEKQNAFLENYSLDVLRNYAPVDGVEVSCNSKIWKTREVAEELKDGLSANIAAIKFRGSDYTLNNPIDKYFIVDLESDENVNLVYNKEWSTKINIDGDGIDDELMIASPVGNQAGLGAMGFCYAPYHFIYDISYPVLVQIYSNEEVFQFPVAVIIDKNTARKAESSGVNIYSEYEDICTYKNQEATINLYDNNLNKIDGRVSFSCLSQECPLGTTENGTLVTNVPTCYNGFLNVKSEGYASKKQKFSSNEEVFSDIVLDKEKEVSVSLEVGGKDFTEGSAIISFSEINGSSVKNVVFPDSENIKLFEGYYEITVYAYSNSSIIIPASKKNQCASVPASGLSGIFGMTKTQCFDIDLPQQKIEQALIGGGKSSEYIFESELEGGKIKLKVDELPKPNSLDELSNNFILFENKGVEVEYG